MGFVQTESVEKKRKNEPIYFNSADLPKGEIRSDSLVITVDMEGTDVERVLIDTGNSIKILYEEVFK